MKCTSGNGRRGNGSSSCLLHRLQPELPGGLVNRVFFEKGETLFEQGEAVAGCHLICHGWVKEFHRTPAGEKRVLRLVGPEGALAVEEVLLEKSWHETAAQAYTDVCVVFLRRQGVQELLRKAKWASFFGVRLAQATEAIKRTYQRSSSSVRARLAALLLELDRQGLLLELPLTNEELGELIGCTPVAVSQNLGRLRRTGALERRRKSLTVLNPQVLEAQTVD
jgi:CRP/FNR family transcriptional regulator